MRDANLAIIVPISLHKQWLNSLESQPTPEAVLVGQLDQGLDYESGPTGHGSYF